MKPVEQTVFGNGKGNCFAACIASLLELPIEEVPNLCDRSLDDGDSNWFTRWAKWLNDRGVAILLINWVDTLRLTGLGMFHCIMTGRSPRAQKSEDDFTHAVVAEIREGVLVAIHDPHPEGGFVVGHPYDLIFLQVRAPHVNRKVGE